MRGPWENRCAMLAIGAFSFIALLGCGESPGSGETARESAPTEQQIVEQRKRQLALLDRLKIRNPEQFTYERTLLNEENELGLVLNRDVDMDKLPNLIRAIMSRMVREFEIHELTIVLYSLAEPPRRIGKVRANADQRTLVYEPEP